MTSVMLVAKSQLSNRNKTKRSLKLGESGELKKERKEKIEY
jgi:hypothetical protein